MFYLFGMSEADWHHRGGRLAYNTLYLAMKLGLVEHVGAKTDVGPHGDTPVVKVQLLLV